MLLREDKLVFNNKTYVFKIFVERRRSVYLSIGRAVHIRLPTFLPLNKREEEILNMKNKFLEYLKKNETKFAPISYKVYNHGDIFKIFNKEYLFNFEYKNKKSSSAKIVGQTICFSLSSSLDNRNKTISSLLNKIISQDLLSSFKERVNY
jgi:predicted metal-dependent hydrolase